MTDHTPQRRHQRHHKRVAVRQGESRVRHIALDIAEEAGNETVEQHPIVAEDDGLGISRRPRHVTQQPRLSQAVNLLTHVFSLRRAQRLVEAPHAAGYGDTLVTSLSRCHDIRDRSPVSNHLNRHRIRCGVVGDDDALASGESQIVGDPLPLARGSIGTVASPSMELATIASTNSGWLRSMTAT